MCMCVCMYIRVSFNSLSLTLVSFVFFCVAFFIKWKKKRGKRKLF